MKSQQLEEIFDTYRDKMSIGEFGGSGSDGFGLEEVVVVVETNEQRRASDSMANALYFLTSTSKNPKKEIQFELFSV